MKPKRNVTPALLGAKYQKINMKKTHEEADTSIKVSPEALNDLAKKAKPFESKKDCLERIIMQSCSPSIKKKESETDLEQQESNEEESE